MTKCPYIRDKTCGLYYNLERYKQQQALTPAYLENICHKNGQKCPHYQVLTDRAISEKRRAK
ncbi:hypothetical protein HOE04_01685 [archaeon]|jgi:hypothetical protein|nr:hypothetical protein [archaeon]